MLAKFSCDKSRIYEGIILLAIFLSPFLTWRIGAINYNYSDLLFSLSAVFLFIQYSYKISFSMPILLWFLGSNILILFLGVSSLIQANNIQNSIIVILQYGFSIFLLPIILLKLDDKALCKCIKAWLIAVAIIGFKALLMAYGFIDPALLSGNMMSGYRYASFMENPNTLAKAISISIALILLLNSTTYKIKSKFNCGFIFLGYIGGLVASSSFAGLISALFVICIYSMFSLNRRVIFTLFILVLAMILFIVWFDFLIPDVFQRRVIRLIYSRDYSSAGSFLERVDRIYEALLIIDRDVLFGIGADGYRDIAPLVHNTFLLVFAEGGIFALLGFLLLLLSVSISAVKLWLINYSLGVAAVAVISVFALNALTTNHLYGRHWIIPLFLGFVLMERIIHNSSLLEE